MNAKGIIGLRQARFGIASAILLACALGAQAEARMGGKVASILDDAAHLPVTLRDSTFPLAATLATRLSPVATMMRAKAGMAGASDEGKRLRIGSRRDSETGT